LKARVFAAALLSLLWGCATTPYVRSADGPNALAFRDGEPRIERGRPNRFVDGLGHYLFSLPVKLLLWSWHVENHDVSPETEAALLEYLDGNGLCRVKLRINQYAPAGEWSRLFRNQEMNGFWRYTFGFLSVAGYMIFPQRLFGGDSFNPFTNTIHIYSDESAVALHEGGHAKDLTERRYKGLYSAIRLIPLVPLYQEGVATGDAVSYLRDEGEAERERQAYPLLWGAWGTYFGGEGARWFIQGRVLYLVQLPIAWLGRLTGWIYAKGVPDAELAAEPELRAFVAESVEEPRCALVGEPDVPPAGESTVTPEPPGAMAPGERGEP